MRFFTLSVLLAVFIYAGSPAGQIDRIFLTGEAQGTSYHITYYAEDTLVSKKQIDSILNLLDSSLSLYKPYSLINQFNRSAEGIIPDIHLKNVVDKALQVYRHTGGLFDITIEPLTSLWGFGPAKTSELPDSSAIRSALSCVNSKLLYWKKSKLRKKKDCVKLDPNGIAQGYSVDVLASFLEKRGITSYLVELGGEIRVKGRKLPGGEKMTIGIEAPGDDPGFSMIEKVLAIDEGAITTSGNYRRYYESEGKKINHLLDPRTGYSIQNELISVTIYAKDAMTADGYDNALMTMGLNKAMAFIEKRKDLAAHFIFRNDEGKIADTMSTRFRALLKP